MATAHFRSTSSRSCEARTAGGSHTRKKRVVCSHLWGEGFPFPLDLQSSKVIRGHGDLE